MISRPPSPRTVLCLLLIALHAAALGLLFVWPDGVWPTTKIGGQLRIASGLVHGEIAVVSAWAAWSPLTIALRVPVAAVASLLAGFVLVMAMAAPTPSGTVPLELIVMAMATALAHCLLILGMCLAASAFGIDWQDLSHPDAPRRPAGQFHLWELLALMFSVALLLGAVRWIWPPDAVLDWSRIHEDFVLLSCVLLAGNLLLSNTVITTYRTRRDWRLNLAITLGIAAVITFLEWLAALRLVRPRSIFMFSWMNGFYLGWLLLSLGLVRAAGYRLTRVRFPQWTRPLQEQSQPLG